MGDRDRREDAVGPTTDWRVKEGRFLTVPGRSVGMGSAVRGADGEVNARDEDGSVAKTRGVLLGDGGGVVALEETRNHHRGTPTMLLGLGAYEICSGKRGEEGTETIKTKYNKKPLRGAKNPRWPKTSTQLVGKDVSEKMRPMQSKDPHAKKDWSGVRLKGGTAAGLDYSESYETETTTQDRR